MEFILNVDTDHFLINCNPKTGLPKAAVNRTTLQGLLDLDGLGEAAGAYI